MPTQFPPNLFLVGCGSMAGNMLARWLDTGLDPACVTVLRPSGKPVAPGVAVVTDYPATLLPNTIILLGMKPYHLADVAARFRPGPGATLISILAGTTSATLRAAFPQVADIVRVMPNMPVGVGQGVCALYSDATTAAPARAAVEALLQSLGLVEWIADESQFNLVTALSGCGPAYLFRFIDALARAATSLGMPAAQSSRLALATIRGAATLASAADEDPAILADRVASSGGMTREGLDVLDAGNALVSLLTETLRAARDRGEAMAKEE